MRRCGNATSSNSNTVHVRIRIALANKVGGLGPQNDAGAAQMGLECIKGGLDFPALMVKCCQPRRLFWNKDGGGQSVDRLGISNAAERVIDDAHHHAVGFMPKIPL